MKDSTFSYFIIFLKACDQQTPLYLFHCACFYMCKHCSISTNQLLLLASSLYWQNRIFSHQLSLDDSLNLSAHQQSCPHLPFPECTEHIPVVQTCQDLIKKLNMDLCLVCTVQSQDVGQNHHSADLLLAQNVMSLQRLQGFQRTLWPFELTSSLLHPNHHFLVHFQIYFL